MVARTAGSWLARGVRHDPFEHEPLVPLVEALVYLVDAPERTLLEVLKAHKVHDRAHGALPARMGLGREDLEGRRLAELDEDLDPPVLEVVAYPAVAVVVAVLGAALVEPDLAGAVDLGHVGAELQIDAIYDVGKARLVILELILEILQLLLFLAPGALEQILKLGDFLLPLLVLPEEVGIVRDRLDLLVGLLDSVEDFVEVAREVLALQSLVPFLSRCDFLGLLEQLLELILLKVVVVVGDLELVGELRCLLFLLVNFVTGK